MKSGLISRFETYLPPYLLFYPICPDFRKILRDLSKGKNITKISREKAIISTDSDMPQKLELPDREFKTKRVRYNVSNTVEEKFPASIFLQKQQC